MSKFHVSVIVSLCVEYNQDEDIILYTSVNNKNIRKKLDILFLINLER